MKTLVELLAAADRAAWDENQTDGEAVAGLVGAVQEWLGQEEMREVMYPPMSYDLPWQVQGRLRTEAGRGLSG